MNAVEQERRIRLLNAICENPGWQPSEQSSAMERNLNELQAGGWILPRLDGWEASPKAVQFYPNFYFDDDGVLRGEMAVHGGTVVHGAPPRDALDRPGYERPASEPAPDDPWETTHVLPSFSVGEKQEIRAAIDIAGLKGGVSIANARPDGQRVEAEITVRIRRVQ